MNNIQCTKKTNCNWKGGGGGGEGIKKYRT